MSDNLKWKSALLSSNMPLEFEASNILVSKGFAVHSGFKYSINDSGVIKDAPVDIHAAAHTPFSDMKKATARIEFLIECRHRHRNHIWLFLPDMNKPDFSPVTLGNTIRIVDQFSPYAVESKASFHFDSKIPVCHKGIEVDTEHGNVSDTVFKEGLARLQYALPRLLTENTLFYLNNHPDDNIPFLFCPILLTTAKLFVASENMNIIQIEASSAIEDIAVQVPYLIIYSDYGPDFEYQCKTECNRLKKFQRSDKATLIEQKRARYYGTQQNLPFTIIESLINAERYYLNTFFTQFIICDKPHFEELVNTIKKTVTSALRTRKFIE